MSSLVYVLWTRLNNPFSSPKLSLCSLWSFLCLYFYNRILFGCFVELGHRMHGKFGIWGICVLHKKNNVGLLDFSSFVELVFSSYWTSSRLYTFFRDTTARVYCCSELPLEGKHQTSCPEQNEQCLVLNSVQGHAWQTLFNVH